MCTESICSSVCVCEGWVLWLQQQSVRQLHPTSFLFLSREERVAVTGVCNSALFECLSLWCVCVFITNPCVLYCLVTLPQRKNQRHMLENSCMFFFNAWDLAVTVQSFVISVKPRPWVHLRCWISTVICFVLLFRYIWLFMMTLRGGWWSDHRCDTINQIR